MDENPDPHIHIVCSKSGQTLYLSAKLATSLLVALKNNGMYPNVPWKQFKFTWRGRELTRDEVRGKSLAELGITAGAMVYADCRGLFAGAEGGEHSAEGGADNLNFSLQTKTGFVEETVSRTGSVSDWMSGKYANGHLYYNGVPITANTFAETTIQDGDVVQLHEEGYNFGIHAAGVPPKGKEALSV